MKFSSMSKAEKLCVIGMGVTLLIIIICAVLLYRHNQQKSGNQAEKNQNFGEATEELADEMINYPTNIQLNKPMKDFQMTGSDGLILNLSDFKGKNVIILFWTSWCKYCKEEFTYMEEYAKLLQNYDDVEFILLNKLDGEKETKEQALEYLEENEIPFTTYFDENLAIYEELGIKIVPTMLGIDSQGVLKICEPGFEGGADYLEAMINYIKFGGSYQTEQFIGEGLTSQEGGVYVNYYDVENESPSGYDVLSESQGIMMEYAVIKKDKVLFDRYYTYVKDKMLISDSLAGWMVTEKGVSKTNSSIDDLRIYRALYDANQLWGGYEEEVNRWEISIYRFNVNSKKQLVDYYDFKTKKKAKRFTLCFADLEALYLLKESNSDYLQTYDNAYELILGGFISNEFPFYYSWYDYEKSEYVADELNMAEAMYTLLHLARVGELKEETITQLEFMMESGGIKARYTTEGKVVEGYNYESTAIYALVAMIGQKIGNDNLITKAIARMEFMRVNDVSLSWNGAFSANEGKDIFSFDQCMPLLAYANLED